MDIGRRLSWSILLFAAGSLLLNGCGGRSINKKLARDVIVGSHSNTVTEHDLQVLSVTQLGSSEAIVETELHTSFHLQKVGGQWIVREARVGQGPWQKMDDIMRTLEQAKIDETRQLFERIAAAIAAYRQKNGHLPQFTDYLGLSDAIFPLYLSPVVRLDPWNHPFTATWLDSHTILLVSAGPDAKLGTEDDIRLSRDLSR